MLGDIALGFTAILASALIIFGYSYLCYIIVTGGQKNDDLMKHLANSAKILDQVAEKGNETDKAMNALAKHCLYKHAGVRCPFPCEYCKGFFHRYPED